MYLIISQLSENQQMYMKKRSVAIYYSLNVSLVGTMIGLISCNIGLLHLSKMGLLITFNFGLLVIMLLFYFLLIKTWKIYYRYKWSYYAIELEWHYIINPKSASQESKNNWFLANNKTYGRLSYISRLFGLYFLIGFLIIDASCCWAIITEFELISSITASSFTVSIMGLAALFYVYLVRNTPYLNDIYQIHQECKIHSKLLLILCSCCGVMNATFIIFQSPYIYLVGGTTMNFPLFAMIYVSTHFLKKHQQKISKDTSVTRHTSISNDVTVEKVVCDDQMIHAFMVHLSKEYSMEILLSFIEFNQFQKYIRTQMERNGIEIPDGIELSEFPANVPKSQIVEGTADDIVMIIDSNKDDTFIDNAKIKAHQLYQKYVKPGSEFEINISFQERNKLSNLLDKLDVLLSCNVNLTDLLSLFEECKGEMKLLLQWSLTRFKNEGEFLDD